MEYNSLAKGIPYGENLVVAPAMLAREESTAGTAHCYLFQFRSTGISNHLFNCFTFLEA